MTWSLVGWVVIGLTAGLLFIFSFLLRDWGSYQVRSSPLIKRFIASRVSAIEQGKRRQVVLGHQLWSQTYPGLGLHALAVLPTFLDPESVLDGSQYISGGDGALVVFARQLIKGRYQNGFSMALHDSGLRPRLHGPTPLSFTAGFLPELGTHPHGSLALFGDYGPEASLWIEAARTRGACVFAAAGSISSQAALYMNMRDLLIGEEVFMLPGLLEPTAMNRAGWLTEDIVRILLILFLIAAAILKMAGVL